MPTSYSPTAYVDGTSPWLEAANLNKAENAIAALASEKVEKSGDSMSGVLTLVGASTTSKVLSDEAGEYQEYPGVLPLRWGQASGTAAAPITVGRPNIKISRRENIDVTEMPNPAANDRNAALQVVSFGLVTSVPQVAAGHFLARGGGTTTGADVNAISGVGIVSNSGATGVGMGAYFEGRREVATANHYGVEITAFNNTATAPAYDAGGGLSDGGVGIWLPSRGASGQDNAVGIQLAGLDGSEWLYGLAAGGTSAVTSSLIRDDTDASTSYLIKGTHAGGAIRIDEGSGAVIIGRNVAATGPAFSNTVLEVFRSDMDADPVAVIGSEWTRKISLQLRNSLGSASLGIPNAANDFLTGTAQGDLAILSNDAGKFIHLGGTVSALRIGQDNSITIAANSSATAKFGTGMAAAAVDGGFRYDSTRKLLAFHDSVRERQWSSQGYRPYAYPIGGAPNLVTTTAQAIAANGGTVAIPIIVEGHMLLEAVSFWNTDAATARGPVEFAIYEGRLGNANSLDLITGAVGSLTTWTPSVASLRTITVTSGPKYLGPGAYWLVIKNNHASNTLGLGSVAAGTMALNTVQTKTLTTAAFGATLDFVAATWTKGTWIAGVRLQGRVFGQATAF